MDPETRATITRIIRSCVYGDLATIAADGKSPRVRPVCAFLQDDLTILVPSHTQTRKVAEIARSPEVEICFVDAEHWQVRAVGRCVLHGADGDLTADARLVLHHHIGGVVAAQLVGQAPRHGVAGAAGGEAAVDAREVQAALRARKRRERRERGAAGQGLGEVSASGHGRVSWVVELVAGYSARRHAKRAVDADHLAV